MNRHPRQVRSTVRWLGSGRVVPLVLCGVATCLAWGCAPAPVRLYEPAARPTTAPATFDDRDWAAVLRENVKDGLVDYDHLSSHSGPLDRFLRMLAVMGPKTTPDLFRSRRNRVSYYVNAYNAGVLKAVLHEGIPATMHDARRPPLDRGYHLLIDGQVWTPGDLREAARVESLGDARVEFCLCDAAVGSPPLSNQPLRPDTLDTQLRQTARQAMEDQRIVSVDHAGRRLNVAVVIWQRRSEFLDYYRRQTGSGSATLLNVLLHMASGVRREWLNTAVGYDEGVIPFVRDLNRWTARSAPGQ